VSATRASFEASDIPRTKCQRPRLNAFSAIEVLVPYTLTAQADPIDGSDPIRLRQEEIRGGQIHEHRLVT
jgi:hypothetical protein